VIVVQFLDGLRSEVVEVLVRPFGVEPDDPFGGAELDVVNVAPGALAADELVLERPDGGLVPRGGSSRKASGRRPGKQPGDAGTALRLVDDPGERIPIPAPAACASGTSLAEEPVVGVRRRQVRDLPAVPEVVVTEYAAEVKCCPGCRANVVGQFPAGVGAPAQYGPEITTRVADVVVGHHVPVHRSTVLVAELLGMQVSTGFAASLRGRAAVLIREGGFAAAVKKLLAAAPVVHADETFARAGGATRFVHVACTDHLTLMHTGNRSADAIDAGGVLTELGAGQVLVRDGYAGYAHLKARGARLVRRAPVA